MGGESISTFQFLGLTFSTANVISGLVAAIIVFAVVFAFSRNLKLKPTGKQNALEWVIDFTNGILRSSVDETETRNFGLYAFTLFLFIFVANQIGLFLLIAKRIKGKCLSISIVNFNPENSVCEFKF
ncbi:F0F1 ATP synthase subunit A, partial [Pediococcus acidilactici]|nr:F0F1 ATP synthase subunit A [Pediococcus acidilactici]